MKRIAVPLLLMGSYLVGCATGPEADPQDPLEPLNRGVYSFNELLDRTLIKPVAEFYSQTVPTQVDESVTNFFNNLDDITVVVNDLLQIQSQQCLEDTSRFLFNTTFGLVGLFDVASDWGLPKRSQDFGQTLGYWGIGAGPYLVLPIWGPRTVRDSAGLVVDSWGDSVYRFEPIGARNGSILLRDLDRRADLLGGSRLLKEAALDQYTFVRETYLQRRASLVAEKRGSGDER